MVYGGILSLVLSHIPLLLKTSSNISRRQHNYLFLYVVFMITIDTIYTVTMVIGLIDLKRFGVFEEGTEGLPDGFYYSFPNGYAGGICVTFASWSADIFMVRS